MKCAIPEFCRRIHRVTRHGTRAASWRSAPAPSRLVTMRVPFGSVVFRKNGSVTAFPQDIERTSRSAASADAAMFSIRSPFHTISAAALNALRRKRDIDETDGLRFRAARRPRDASGADGDIAYRRLRARTPRHRQRGFHAHRAVPFQISSGTPSKRCFAAFEYETMPPRKYALLPLTPTIRAATRPPVQDSGSRDRHPVMHEQSADPGVEEFVVLRGFRVGRRGTIQSGDHVHSGGVYHRHTQSVGKNGKRQYARSILSSAQGSVRLPAWGMQ